MRRLDWYFDFISPYAWLQSTRLEHFAGQAELHCKPILFAGLLRHWGQKGPAEMETKRTWTYQQIAWLAHQEGLKLTWPPRHPFNPLPLLRLCALLGSTRPVIHRLYAWVWEEGHLPDEPGPWAALLAEYGVSPEALEAPAVKDIIRRNTDEALARGLFGVPSALVTTPAQDGAPEAVSPIFWGFDATPMLQAWLAGHSFFQSAAWQGASNVGAGVVRKSSP